MNNAYIPITLAVLGAAGLAMAGPNTDIDNSATNPGNGFASLNADYNVRQSFIPNQNNICGATIYLGVYWGSDDITLSIWQTDPYFDNGANPVAGASGTVFGNANSYVDVSWSPQAITAGNQYWLLVQGTNGSAVANFSNTAYGGGSVWFQQTDYGQYGYDLAFKTYYAVPAPASAALLGLGGLAVSRRRRA